METCSWAFPMAGPAMLFALLAGGGILAWGMGQYARYAPPEDNETDRPNSKDIPG